MKTIVPQEFLNKYRNILKEDFNNFYNYCFKPLKKSIYVNTNKISVKKFKEYTLDLKWQLEPIPWTKAGFWIERDDRNQALGKHFLHTAGYFYIQEASSMLPPEILKPQKGDFVLDMAAAPGSKTVQMASLMKNQGIIVANEPELKRLKALVTNLDRMGVQNVLLTKKEGQVFSRYFPNFFDKILLDAPCSGEGTIRKDRQALENWSQKKVEVMVKLQKVLMFYAFKSLKAGGEMVYSTCTLSYEENEEVVQNLLEKFPGNACIQKIKVLPQILIKKYHQELAGTLRVWPHLSNTEGFFVAKIKKQFPTEESEILIGRRRSPFKAISKKTWQELHNYLFRSFNIKLENKDGFYERNHEIWLRPTEAEKIASRIILERQGVLLGKNYSGVIKLTSEGALFFAENFNPTKGVIDLSEEEVQDFLSGRDFYRAASQDVLCRYKNIFIGYGKGMGNKIKNKLPRHLVT